MTAAVQPTLFPLTPQGAASPLAAPTPARVETSSPRPAVIRDELDAIWHDWRPWAVEDRDVVLHAIAYTAADCGGLVHATDVRRHLSRDVNPCVIGAVVTALVRQGVLEDTGWVRRLGEGTMRNRTKRLPVRRLIAPLPAA